MSKNSILDKKLQESMGGQNEIHEMQVASWKQIKWKEHFAGFEFFLTEMCFPSPGSRHNYKLTMILRQHYHYIGHVYAFITNMGRDPWAPSLDLPLFLSIGRCRENSFDNLNI